MTGLPTVFLSHGAPTVVIETTPQNEFLRSLAGLLPRPKAILIASAHWLTGYPALTSSEYPEMIYDFQGFPAALYQMSYPAPGAPALAGRAADLLAQAGLKVGLDQTRGLDHGAWTPLILAWPQADIPVVQLSIQPHLDPAHHVKVGRALAPLRDEGVLIIGSGAFTHNLAAFFTRGRNASAPPLSGEAFADWIDGALARRDMEALMQYRDLAPFAHQHHPTDEHFLPFFVALGAAGPAATAQKIHSSGIDALRNDCYRFD